MRKHFLCYECNCVKTAVIIRENDAINEKANGNRKKGGGREGSPFCFFSNFSKLFRPSIVTRITNIARLSEY